MKPVGPIVQKHLVSTLEPIKTERKNSVSKFAFKWVILCRYATVVRGSLRPLLHIVEKLMTRPSLVVTRAMFHRWGGCTS